MSEKVVYRGPGFLTLLTLLFIALKLTGHITWSWLWVLSPIWLAISLGLTIFVTSLLVTLYVMRGVK